MDVSIVTAPAASRVEQGNLPGPPTLKACAAAVVAAARAHASVRARACETSIRAVRGEEVRDGGRKKEEGSEDWSQD